MPTSDDPPNKKEEHNYFLHNEFVDERTQQDILIGVEESLLNLTLNVNRIADDLDSITLNMKNSHIDEFNKLSTIDNDLDAMNSRANQFQESALAVLTEINDHLKFETPVQVKYFESLSSNLYRFLIVILVLQALLVYKLVW